MKAKILTALAVFGLCLIAIWLGISNIRLTDELRRRQLKPYTANRPSRNESTVALPRSDINPSTRLSTVSFAEDNRGQKGLDAAQAARKLRDDPTWRAQRFNIAIIQVEARYGRFFGSLVGWSPERIEALKRQMASGDVALEQAALPQTLPITDEEQNAISAAMDATTAENARQLKDSLGDADYARFDASDKAQPYRDSVDSIANAMRSKNIQVSADLEESILGAYSNAVLEAAAKAEPVDMQSLSEAERSALRQKQQSAFRTVLLGKMSTVLDEQQLSVFLESELEQSGGG